MAAIAEIPNVTEPVVPTKKSRSRKALKPKDPSPNEVNILAGDLPESSPDTVPTLEKSVDKENLSEPRSLKKNKKKVSKAKKQQPSVEDPSPNEVNNLAGTLPESSPESVPTLEKSVDKENLSEPKSLKKNKKKTSKAKNQQPSVEVSSFEKEMQEMQEMLEKLKIEKENTEEMLKQKEEELQIRDKEQEKLKNELKKLQKLKEFKPTMTLPMGMSLKEQEQEKKDKKKTKKPSPAYVLWCKDHWNEVKEANPDADFKVMSNLLAEMWKTVTKEEKKPYEENYQAQKEAYLKIVGTEKRELEAMKLLEDEQKQKTAMDLLEQYLQFKQEAEKDNNKKKTKKEKDPSKPKHPMSAYFVFSNERRAALREENKNVTEIAKITGEEWKNMTDNQKAPYEKIAGKNKEQYVQEMEAYKQMKDEESANLKKEEEELMKIQKQEAMQLLKKKEKTDNLIKITKETMQKQKKEKAVVDPNKPKKPASSFILFSKEARKNLTEEQRQGMNFAAVNALISVKWKELSEEEKKVWNDEAAKGMEVYKKELEAYNNKLA